MKHCRRSLSWAAILCLAFASAAHDPEETVAELDQRIRAAPRDARLLLERALAFLAWHKPARALADADRSLRIMPALSAGHFARAQALRALGRDDAALDALDRFLAARPLHARATLEKARVLTTLDRKDEALHCYCIALADSRLRRPGVYLARARVVRSLGTERLVDAVRSLEEAVATLGPIVALTLELDRYRAELTREQRASLAAMTPPGPTPSPPPAGGPSTPNGLVDTILVAKGATWKYHDQGADLGTAWRALAFDDSKWAKGPAQLGYGDGDEKTVVSFGKDPLLKHITTWFRHAFTTTKSFKTARVNLLRDDGAIVWLNGIEVARSNMLPTKAGYKTRAPAAIGGTGERTFYTQWFDPKLVKKGTNVLAVEVHQVRPTSSDLSFDLELVGSDLDPDIARGPYLQLATPTSIVLRWKTEAATDSGVWLGSTPSNLTLVASSTALTVDHELAIKGLGPGKRYAYAVGTRKKRLAGGDAAHVFLTPPRAGTAKPTRLWVVGDSGTANAAARSVRDAFKTYTGKRDPDLFLMLGDNAYMSGLDDEYQRAVFETYDAILRRVPVWPTLGNHDGVSAKSASRTGAYYDVFTLPAKGEAGGLASGTEAYYSFDHGDIHIVCLNSQDVDRAATGAMLTWLKSDLAASKARWNLAFWHHPPYSKGSHDSDIEQRLVDMRRDALPVLEAAGIDLVLSGHSHSYERSYLLDGHYGASTTLKTSMLVDRGDGRSDGDGAYVKPSSGRKAHEGAVYVVAGTSGLVGGGTLDHPVMHVSLATLGSLVIDIDGASLVGRFVSSRGTVRDRFVITKGLTRSLTRDAPRVSVAAGGKQRLFLDAGTGHAGRVYIVLGSFATKPGMIVGGLHLPLNDDGWHRTSILLANSSVLQNTLGFLDGKGRAQATLALPPKSPPAWVGTSVHHAFLVFDASLKPAHASNAVRLLLEK